MEKGILTKELEKKLGQKLDDLIKLPGILESIDGFAFTQTIRALDNYFGDKIPEPYKSKLQEEFILIFEEEDYEEAIKKAAKFANDLIDIPALDDEMENLIFNGLAQILIGILLKKVPEA